MRQTHEDLPTPWGPVRMCPKCGIGSDPDEWTPACPECSWRPGDQVEQCRDEYEPPGPRCILAEGHDGPHLYRCAGEHCPGLPWPASARPHPQQCTTGRWRTGAAKLADAKSYLRRQVTTTPSPWGGTEHHCPVCGITHRPNHARR